MMTPLKSSLQRLIYDAGMQMSLPGQIVRREGDPPTGDPSADETYDALGITYDFFKSVFDRNSIDDQGMPLVASVHYGKGYDNAFWNGKQMIIGDGDEDLPVDQRLFNRFSKPLDVISKEFMNGLQQYGPQLEYYDQAGALSNSFGVVFSTLVKQFHLKQTVDEANWLFGEGLFTPNVNGKSLSSLAAPGTAYDDPVLGKDPQPSHMNDYNKTSSDNGGVHINSGIPNHAFYLIAAELGGYAWEKAGRIWYEVLMDKRLKPKSGFEEFAQLTVSKAGELFGEDSKEKEAVKNGWEAVGVTVGKKRWFFQK